MFFLFAACLVLCIPLSDGFFNNFGMLPTCLYSSGADLTEVKNMLKGETMTRSGRCFIKCIGEKSGLIQNGILHPEKLGWVPKLSSLDSKTKSYIQKCLQDFQGSKIQYCDDVGIIEKCLRLIPDK